MKARTTQKFVKRINRHVIQLYYCEAQNLLRYSAPALYTAGVYGWNADVYDVGADAVVTGYRPFGDVRPDPELVKQYDAAAEKIDAGIAATADEYEEKARRVRSLLAEFVRAAVRAAETKA